ncbi:DUF3025 domain-containing protein [Rhodanobacter sp. AS-Z3]|uniref:DUF3025 domain-containing protein n=1 Tax=Rhodanobacter sp. AS-Z3 TaxID=3031330 RepID=UPI00247909FA|nr:DUF3025 domain-containing protein [Rhodanobacter sp. AS-Z3]WEN16762.1 DUF3025 domain-containing protein [Rhodanobacter sp. AS-Z3]
MRYVAPARDSVDPAVFARMPLAGWRDFSELLEGAPWPSIDALNQRWPDGSRQRFVAQTPALLGDGLHYEQRIAECGLIATRENNWHDLLNAMIWLRYPSLKQALNRRQIDEMKQMGPKQRSRAQYAMTHFDEGGVIVALSDPSLLALWDAHDWYGLFWQRRQAWLDGSIQVELFGHALLELALNPGKLLVGKALVFHIDKSADLRSSCAAAVASGQLLHDPLELRPLPLSGLPGWHADSADEAFHRSTPCYQPRRAGRSYPPVFVQSEPEPG